MESNNKVLTRRDIGILGLRSILLQASFNYERMQAGGFAWSFIPALKKIFGDDKEKMSAALKDNLEFINTHPVFVGFLMGLMISMEEAGESRELIKGIKIALFGPLAGIGDALFWFTIYPIMIGICGSFAADGNVLGPILFVAFYVVVFIGRVALTFVGYDLGVNAIGTITKNSEIVSNSATILGITVLGALICDYVNLNIVASITTAAGNSVAIQTFFDMIIPNLLPFAVVMLIFYFIRKKQASPLILISAIITLCLIGSLLGIV